MAGKRFEVKPLPRKNLLEIRDFPTYPTISLEFLKKKYEHAPDLFLGCYDEGTLIGFAFGYPQKAMVILHALAVKSDYQKQRLGSRLLSTFEQQVKQRGYERITVGAAENVDCFYLKHNYKPISVLVRIPYDELPANYRKFDFEIIEEETAEGETRLKIPAKTYDPKRRKNITKEFHASEAIYIYEKVLTEN